MRFRLRELLLCALIALGNPLFAIGGHGGGAGGHGGRGGGTGTGEGAGSHAGRPPVSHAGLPPVSAPYNSTREKEVPPTTQSLNENNLTGDWGGRRKNIADIGIIFSMTYTYDTLGNPVGGLEQSFAQDGAIEPAVKFLFDQFGWKGGSLFTSIQIRNGSNLSRKIDNLFWASEQFGGETAWMDEFYFKQILFDEKMSIRAGRLNTNYDLMFSPLYQYYVNGALNGNPAGPFFNAVISSDPWATWGIYIDAKMYKVIKAKFAAYNPNEHIFDHKWHGVNSSFHTSEGAQLWTEWAYQLNDEPEDTGLPGHYMVGYFYYTGKFETFRGGKQRGNYGYYFLFDQKVYQPGSNKGGGTSSKAYRRRGSSSTAYRGRASSGASRRRSTSTAAELGDPSSGAHRGRASSEASRRRSTSTAADPADPPSVASQGSASSVADPGDPSSVASQGGTSSGASPGGSSSVANQGSASSVADPGDPSSVASQGGTSSGASPGGSSSVASQGSASSVADPADPPSGAHRGRSLSKASQQSTSDQGGDSSASNRGIIPWVAFTFAPKNRNMMPFFFMGGINYVGPFEKRPNDVLNIAYAYGKISTELRHLQGLAEQGANLNNVMNDLVNIYGDEPQNFEAVIEINYWFQFNPWFTVAPDFQYIFNPNATNNIRDVIVIGVRTAITF
jgi:carbohydrate-selective porin OprB